MISVISQSLLWCWLKLFWINIATALIFFSLHKYRKDIIQFIYPASFYLLPLDSHLQIANLSIVIYNGTISQQSAIHAFSILLKMFSGIWMLTIWKFVHKSIKLANKCYKIWRKIGRKYGKSVKTAFVGSRFRNCQNFGPFDNPS